MNVAELISTDYRRALIGIGVTGMSVARHLLSSGKDFVVFDTREVPAGLDEFKQQYPGVEVHLGTVDSAFLSSFREIILSPGLDPKEEWLQEAARAGANIFGDIELFAQAVNAPVIAITGSNAKSTVTTLVGEMAKKAGIKTAVGGNLGTAALDLLSDDIELYVLELSSFQLELTKSLKPKVATVLNMSPDHMDRYSSMIQYHAAKQRIYSHAEMLAFNREDQLTQPLVQKGQKTISFGSDAPDIQDYGLNDIDGETWLVKGSNRLVSACELALKGTHNLTNILAAFALGEAFGFAQEAMIEVAKNFNGLPHRSQTVAVKDSVCWIDDSKATNVGAVKAAIKGLGKDKNIVLIAGGQAKGQSFEALKPLIARHVKQLVLIGEDADQIAAEAAGDTPAIFAINMAGAVQAAAQAASEGDTVLLSPACASFDMFSGYQQRAEAFVKAVEAL